MFSTQPLAYWFIKIFERPPKSRKAIVHGFIAKQWRDRFFPDDLHCELQDSSANSAYKSF